MDYPKPDDDGDSESCSCSGQAVSPSLYGDARAEIRRRDFAKFLATVGGLTAVASLSAPLASTTQVFERSYEGPIYSDGVALIDENGDRVTETTLAEGEHMTVFPEPRPGIEDAPTLLVRFAESDYSDAIDEGFVVSGYAAFSKICTHAGCLVAEREGNEIVCPCHFGKFDMTDGAAVTGGPPGRPLPQLPITLTSAGELVATGDFDGAIGPGGE
ncbi:ubiquinol-cytochrome c reductase iron-sulfur subunit [Haloarcula salinisoli]|uniref:Rieske 2Fe-2S domain-containing protein n=1 Tax=Haloarcula salinisoli TaxID=2487746 RepID=A0A8J7Y9X2_9EURY|nr:Rieske 2Fe-2S domain-containing protein [Halomicroarcula salinisoli]MBX0286367.1 Rieske 2Fe-2S domain-containing protein [Halomicroarcula salinisoli]MBX0302145.1 Rieske 2Fe-2S domain-containing protein [Halomicroarcula salinisoli]